MTKHVVVVGGGLIGLCTSYWLLRTGHRVTIVERSHLGAGAATGNAGELTPQMVAPLASSNTARDIVSGLFSTNSYLSISPLKLPQLAGFGLGFLASSLPQQRAKGDAALAQFLPHMLPSLEAMAADGVDTSGGGTGYLMTARDEPTLLAAHALYADRAARGWAEAPGEPLSGAALRAAEPALTPETEYGFMLPGEFSLDPVTFVASLISRVEALGAEVRTGLEAVRLDSGASVVCRDEDAREVEVRGDRVVLASGAWTTGLLRRSGIYCAASVTAGKGYSFTVPVEQMPATLVHSMDLHCVAIPMHGRLRIVGMMEFDGMPERTNADRFDVLAGFASQVIAGADWEARTDEWMGPRPMTSDGLPLLGRLPGRDEVIVAAGHNMHGLSLGPLTGQIVTDLVDGREPGVDGWRFDLGPFAVRRLL
ncbi:NAD(P)/FAD-dependent oxidoreductase [Gulosibacter sediminis]|uniref:NAD(P)/FAD-dependent oxidoreductase n=1 Tax=Gulosibacter sediminis TaxID=1729695 RepID=UPI0024A8DC3D|nr:FAD-binding oxidoreductase [Gulosibacter sediminis]